MFERIWKAFWKDLLESCGKDLESFFGFVSIFEGFGIRPRKSLELEAFSIVLKAFGNMLKDLEYFERFESVLEGFVRSSLEGFGSRFEGFESIFDRSGIRPSCSYDVRAFSKDPVAILKGG